MGSEKCFLSFPSWIPDSLRQMFCEMSAHKPVLKYPEDYGECHGATFQDSGNHQYKWLLDLAQYVYHPASIWKKGEDLGLSKSFSDNRNVIAIKSIETFGNGDTEKGGGERPYGNIWGTITAEQCQSVSPLIETDDSDYVGQTLTKFRTGQEELDYKSLGFPPDIEDMRETEGAAIAIFPGPYPSDTFPAGKDSKPQCEFGLQWQKVIYRQGKPFLDMDDTRLPTTLVGAQYYCIRFWESDGPAFWTDDTQLLQFTVNVDELKRQGTITYAHNPIDQKAVLSGKEASESPSLFKIEVAFLPEVQEPASWGK